MKLSIILPIYNEAENLKILLREISEALSPLGVDYEIIAVNDGSADNSYGILKEVAKADQRIKAINFRGNFGQTAALSAGFDSADGEIIIPLDADLQNNPADIPLFLKKIDEGYEIVSGWRKDRQDKLFTRKIPSWLANALISRITKVRLRDYGCTMKAYKKEILHGVRLYGEMHRFIPALASWHGARIAEIVVSHRERKFGKTKYGLSRTFRVILDLLTVKFLTKYATRPMHFFGGFGLISAVLGFISFAFALYLRFVGFAALIQTPLPSLGIFFSIASLQLILMGLLAEMIMRNNFESQNKKTYIIKEKINF